ncbi:formylglycine-generating enzyme family protein [Allosaccharopolyspora coralli]|nr:formylglycine-generating enzyme family protein [Allosaccharopolyspora coralli]
MKPSRNDAVTDIATRGAVRDDAEMVLVPAGNFMMGSDDHYVEEAPAHPVQVESFRIDRYPVTNDQFARFVAATDYVTVAERTPGPVGLSPGSLVFGAGVPGAIVGADPVQWWSYVQGACWWRPQGPGSGLEARGDHPVVQVCFEDAAAYAAWAGKELPTEAEWEYAARGGLDGATFCWGHTECPGGELMANTWQGEFPWVNRTAAGWEGTSPVGAFPPNGYGLYDLAGNVWEWTMDFWRPVHSGSACCTVRNPQVTAPDPSVSLEDAAALEFPQRVLKGGSHLCSGEQCFRYRPAARQGENVDTATTHVGFRCVYRPGPSGAFLDA